MSIALNKGSVTVRTDHTDLSTVKDEAKWGVTISRTALKDRTAAQINDLGNELKTLAVEAGYETETPEQ